MKRKVFFEIEKALKKALPLFKKESRLLYQTDGGFYVSDGHFILKATAAAYNDIVIPVYDDFKPCEALKTYTGTPEKSFVYEIIGSYKDGKNTFTVLAHESQYKVVSEKLLKPFISDETIFYEPTADIKTDPTKTPLYISTEKENIGLLLPVHIPGKSLDDLKNLITAAAQTAEKEKEKIKGLFYSIGPDAIFIKGGRKDEKTINTIISWIADIRKIDLSKVKPEVIAATAEAVKKGSINCTCELVKDPAGNYYRFTDNKNFFHHDPVVYKNIPVWTENGDIMTYNAGYVTKAEKAEAATAEPENAENNINMEVENMNDENKKTEGTTEATPEAIQNTEAVKTETAALVTVTFKDGSKKEFSPEVAEALKNDPCVDYIGEPGTPEKAEEAPEEVKTEEKPEAVKKAPEKAKKEPEPLPELKPDDITPANYKEIAFQFFGGLGKKCNSDIILLAGVDADAISCEAFKAYLFEGKKPAFHTFETWKSGGYIVKKGEKAAFKADIWKYTEKHGKMTAEEAEELNKIIINADGSGLYHEGDETTKSRFIKKLSFFFGPDQVEKIEKKDFTAPEGCKLEKTEGKEIITGDTRPYKEAIKAAGFFWDKKNKYWYRAA